MKKDLIVINIPKNKESMYKTLLALGDDTWDTFNILVWCKSDCKYIYFDKTRNCYNYTNYEDDYNSKWFKNKNLTYIDYKDLVR